MSLNSSLKASGQESLRAVYTLYGKWLQVEAVCVPVQSMWESQKKTFGLHTVFKHTLVLARKGKIQLLTVTTHSFIDDKLLSKTSLFNSYQSIITLANSQSVILLILISLAIQYLSDTMIEKNLLHWQNNTEAVNLATIPVSLANHYKHSYY